MTAQFSLFPDASCFINGKWVAAASGNNLAVLNPANGSLVGHVPMLDSEEVNAAVLHAQSAWKLWRTWTAKERAAKILRWSQLLDENRAEIARILTMEQGKPLAEADWEIRDSIAELQWASGECQRTSGEVIVSSQRNVQPLTMKQPIGVVGAIVPWNFPLVLMVRKCGSALGAGCTVVLKPSSETPFSAMAMAALAEKAGIPAGVLNVVTGSASMIGDIFANSNVIRVLSFTGSTEVGKKLLAACASTVKKACMELGGNSPFVVFDDADLDLASQKAVGAKQFCAGQVCICPNRFFVQRGVYEAFLNKCAALTSGIRIGNGLDPQTTMGPLISASAAGHVQELVNDALKQGARLLSGGGCAPQGENYFQFTILADVTPSMRIHNEEIFGPVMAVSVFDTEEEAVEKANDTPFGLAAYVFSKDMGRVWRTASGIESGMVGVNECGIALDGEVPFGGIKQSGLGRENGHLGVDEYLETKYVLLAALGN